MILIKDYTIDNPRYGKIIIVYGDSGKLKLSHR